MALEASKHGQNEAPCEEWAALLTDKLDGTLAPEREAAFAAHAAQCPSCGLLLEEAERGREWLRMLRDDPPEPPVQLLGKILAVTGATGRATDHPLGSFASAHGGAAAPWRLAGVLPAHSGFGTHQARLLLTAAMAVFSVALTFSLFGLRLPPVHAAELNPGAVQASVSRSFYDRKKQLVSFYENWRFANEVESRVRTLQKNNEAQAPSLQPQRPAPNPKGHGHALAEPEQPAKEWRGTLVLARLDQQATTQADEPRSGL
jgi:hypothetical protein